MNISKYVSFKLINGHSKKNDKDYYAIAISVGDYEFPLVFITKDRYDAMKSTLN